MKNFRLSKKISEKFKDNHGTTLVEVIVTFALLAIFMVCSAMIISTITNMYYNIKGEIYSKEVSDILMEKIASELDGAQYFDDASKFSDNPKILSGNDSIELYDKTGTHVTVLNDSSKGLVIHYHGFEYYDDLNLIQAKSREDTDWFFNESIYNGFKLQDIRFYRGKQSIQFNSFSDKEEHGLSGLNLDDYDENVVLVLIKLRSEKYGTYYYHEFVKMFNVPETLPTTPGT